MASRPADFAGSWYPGKERECIRAIEEMSRESVTCPEAADAGIGGIVPHAGWYYSGRIACNVIKCLAQKNDPDTIIIFGRHLSAGSQSYIMKEGKWETPLGELEVDSDLGSILNDEFPFTVETTSQYEPENTIELQLPLVKYYFPKARILPLGLPPKRDSLTIADRAARAAAELGRSVIVLGSTDLTHYGYNYGYVPKGSGESAVDWVKGENDRRMVDLMLQMDDDRVIREALEHQNACCSGAVAGAIAAAKTLGAKRGEKIIYSTSYDVRPDSSFVGYVGIIFY